MRTVPPTFRISALSESSKSWDHDLSTTEGCDHVRRGITYSLKRHVDQRVIIRLQRDTQVELLNAVGAQQQPVASSGQNLAAKLRGPSKVPPVIAAITRAP